MMLNRTTNNCVLKQTIKSVSSWGAPLPFSNSNTSCIRNGTRRSKARLRDHDDHHHHYKQLLSTSTADPSSSLNTSTNKNVVGVAKTQRVLIKDLGEGIYNVQLNRPEKCNALDMQMFETIGETISALQKDYKTMNIRCIILSGNGRAFCTGLDVPAMINGSEMTMPHTKMNRLLERPSGYDNQHKKTETSQSGDNNGGIGNLAQDVAFLWRSIPTPVIAVLHGMCYGGGMQVSFDEILMNFHQSMILF